MGNNDKYILQSVDNALTIIELMARAEEMTVPEISRQLNLGKSTVFRLLATLERHKFVEKDEKAKYRLGIKFAHFGSVVLERQDLIKISVPYMSELRDRFNETTHLAILDDDYNIIFVVKEKSNSSIQMTSSVGKKMPAYCTATGKTILAHLAPEEIDSYIQAVNFKRLTCNTITDPSEFKKELETIKSQGFGEDLEESEVGLTCFAAPVRDIKGDVVAAVSISGPSSRMQSNRSELIDSVKTTAKNISRAFGWQKKE